MGCSTSVIDNGSKGRRKTIPNIPGQDTALSTTCRKHPRNVLTHLCEISDELLCLSCYENYKRLRRGSQTKSFCEINTYVNSLKFKQAESRTIEKLRSRKSYTENQIKYIEHLQGNSKGKREELLETINAFVATVINLLKHLEEDLCKKVSKCCDEETSMLQKRHDEHQMRLEELEKMQGNVGLQEHDVNKGNVLRLRNIIECKSVLNQNKDNLNAVDAVEVFKVRLNKDLTLKSIIGHKQGSDNVSLGEILVTPIHGSGIGKSTTETLSDISEIEDLESEENQSSGENTPTNEKLDTTKRISNNIKESCEKNDISDDNSSKNGLSTSGKTRDLDNKSFGHSRDLPSPDLYQVPTHITLPNSHESQLQSPHKMRRQFERDTRDTMLTRNIQRSRSRTPNQMTPISQRTNYSMLSPTKEITTPSGIQLATPSTQTPSNTPVQRLAVKRKQIKLPQDNEIHNITCTTVLTDARLVLCDQKNQNLILLDVNSTYLDQIKVKGQPHNLTTVPSEDGQCVAVTIPELNLIQLIRVISDHLKDFDEVIQTKPKCRGIEYVNGKFIYTSFNDVAITKGSNSERTRIFDYAFRVPVSLLADYSKELLFVTCKGLKSSGEIVKMHIENEKIEFRIACKEIKHPVSCSYDRNGFIYVCDIQPPRIHQITPDGKYCRVILDSYAGKLQHVNFLPSSDVFVVTENDCDQVTFYEMQ